MTESSPALYTLAVVVVAGFVISVGGNAFTFSAENSVHASQNRTETTNPCPTVGTTDGRFTETRTTFETETVDNFTTTVDNVTTAENRTRTTRTTRTTDDGFFTTGTEDGDRFTTRTTETVTTRIEDGTFITGTEDEFFTTETNRTVTTERNRTETTTPCPTVRTGDR